MMFLQRSRSYYFCQLLTLAAILVLVAAGGRPGRIKGVRSLDSHEEYSSGANSRILKKKKKKTKFHGPNQRACTTSAKRNEVKFECRTRAADGGSRDNSRDSPKSSKGSKSSSHSADEVGDDYERQDRGISIVPDPELIKDKIKYKIKTEDDGISVKLEYENEIEMEMTETETKTKFELLFYEIVEYVKKTNDDQDAQEEDKTEAYEWNEDDIVQSFPLTDWMDIPDIVNADDGIVSYFTATTANLGMEGGTVAFNFTISRADLDRGESVTANSMKIDVLIQDFPWSRQDSYVAILSTLQSEKKVKVEYEKEATVGEGGRGKGKKAKDVVISFGGEDTMESTFGFSTYGEYTWANEAAVTTATTADGPEMLQTEDSGSDFTGTVVTGRQGGTNSDPSPGIIPVQPPTTMVEEEEEEEVINNKSTTIEVIATSPGEDEDDDNNVRNIAYSFVGAAAQGASDIYWDPQAGIGYQSSSSSHGAVQHGGFFMGLAGTTLVFLFFSLSAFA